MAITVPNIIQSSQNKEFHTALKKNISVIENALSLAQVEEGLMGDNTAIFTPTNDSDRNYQSALRLSKYVNTLKVCKRKDDIGCEDLYYNISYGVKEWDKPDTYSTLSKVVLSDGTIYAILQYPTCKDSIPACKKDQYGKCLKDENGHDIMGYVWNKTNCAFLFIDVNGERGPNKYGQDNFRIIINRNNIVLENAYSALGGKIAKDIMINKI